MLPLKPTELFDCVYIPPPWNLAEFLVYKSGVTAEDHRTVWPCVQSTTIKFSWVPFESGATTEYHRTVWLCVHSTTNVTYIPIKSVISTEFYKGNLCHVKDFTNWISTTFYRIISVFPANTQALKWKVTLGCQLKCLQTGSRFWLEKVVLDYFFATF